MLVNLDLIPIESNNNMAQSDASGNVLATSSDDGAVKNINLTVPAAGKYYIRVFGENSGDLYNVEVSYSSE